jgi:DNA-binding SARP family transcriptional activator/tetratricopeptide (TPR) repeat protein/TolB-like protein
LALLARAGERGVSRERILSLLWPDADDERGPRALAQAVYALRKELGAEDIIVGAKELRLDPALASSDASEFSAAVSRGDDARAVAWYQGPFLDGFHVPGADEFSRWVERERTALAHDHLRSLEALARASLARGSAPEALSWWRRIAALDPLNARFTIGLMEALVASGDRAGAIKQSHVYHLLVEQELDLPPDKEVMALAERLRAGADAPNAVPLSASPSPQPTLATIQASPPLPPAQPSQLGSSLSVAAEPPSMRPDVTRRHHGTRRIGAAIALLILVAVAGYGLARAGGGERSSNALRTESSIAGPIIAVGQIASYGTDSAAKALAGPVSDLLATSLARAPGLRVVSRGRLLELMHGLQPNGVVDTSAGGFVSAARRADATEVIDGTVYARPDGRLRLDLRRTHLATGAIGDAYTVEGSDLFALVDSGTARLVAALGTRPLPPGSVADVTTRSATAYRMYEQGIRAYFRGDDRTASALFEGAIAEDSMFALATYYSSLVAAGASIGDSALVRLERAKRLAARAPDRERLTILAGWANAVSSPALQQIAETLATRYPTEVEGYLYTGIARVYSGDFVGGIAPLEHTVAMDSVGAGAVRPTCSSCEALRWLVTAYALADSFPAAEREARRWVRLQPGSRLASTTLAGILDEEGRAAQSDSVFHAGAPADASYDDVLPYRAQHLIRIGAYDTADRLLIAKTKEPAPSRQLDAYWLLTISLREQGRLAEALNAARHLRPISVALSRRSVTSSVLEAQLQLESSRPLVAATLFDSIARVPERNASPSQLSRASAWILTHAANARAAAGDTIAVARLVDSIRVLGSGSGFGRDQRLFHHVRGLLLAARHDDAGAIAEFQRAVYSLSGGYTRTNYELARLFLHNNRPRDAVAVLQPALRGTIDGSNIFLNRTELHELLAQAWDAAGTKDSAAAHYAVVARAWAGGDPRFRNRADSARRRLVSLGAR